MWLLTSDKVKLYQYYVVQHPSSAGGSLPSRMPVLVQRHMRGDKNVGTSKLDIKNDARQNV